MIRLVTLLIIAGLFATGMAWLADRAGGLTITIGTYEYHTSVAIAAALLTLLVIAGFYLLRLFSLLWRSPGIFGHWMSARKQRAGYDALSQGLIAAAANNAEEARKAARKAESLLGERPLALLLTAQSARLDNDEEKQSAAYRAMLARPEMEYLGARGLFDQAMRGGDNVSAAEHAQRALKLRPLTSPWAFEALFDMAVGSDRLDDAQGLLDDAIKQKALDAETVSRFQTALAVARARQRIAQPVVPAPSAQVFVFNPNAAIDPDAFRKSGLPHRPIILDADPMLVTPHETDGDKTKN